MKIYGKGFIDASDKKINIVLFMIIGGYVRVCIYPMPRLQ